MVKKMKKALAFLGAISAAMSISVSATNIVTEYDEEKDSIYVIDGAVNEQGYLGSDNKTEEEFSLFEYRNKITIIAPSSTISQVGGTITLVAEIEDRAEQEGVMWSIASGDLCASINQAGVVTALKNGTAVIKAYSTVDSTKVAYKTIIVSIVDSSVSVRLDVSAQYGNIQNTTTEGVVQQWYDSKTASYPQGTKFKLEAMKKNGQDSTFMYWLDSKSSRVVSFNPVYEFVLGTETTLQAVYAYSRNADNKFIAFKDINDKILTQGYTSSSIKVPQDPAMLGYSFRCWTGNGHLYDFVPRDIVKSTDVSGHTIFKAGYVKKTEKYMVSIVGANIEGGEYMYNDFVSVTHKEAEEGKRFAYWTRDGKIVSYDADYSFYVGNFDTTVEAVFVDIDDVVAEIPIIVMSEPQIVETNKISFVAERNLPSQYKLIETGIILSSSKSDIDLETTGILKAKSTSVANKGQYSIRKKDVNPSETWFARGYMIYLDGKTVVTIYSEPVYKSL